MNFKIIFSAGLIALATGSVFAQNKSNGTIVTASPILPSLLPPGNTEAFRFSPGLITQLDLGTGFDFTSSSQWSSLGRLSTTGQTLYGLRVQRAGRGLIFGYSGAPQGSTPTLGTPVIQWVGEGAVTPGDLLFRTSASSTSATSTQVLKLRSDATAVLATASKYETGNIVTYPGFNSDTDYLIPKLEINYIDAEGLSVVTENASFERGRAAVFSNRSTFANGRSIGSGSYSESSGGLSYAITSRATSSATGTGTTYGVIAEAAYGSSNNGVYGRSFSANSTSNVGVRGQADGNSATGTANYGVYGYATGNNAFAGYFSGRIFSTNALVVSDKSLKSNVKKEENVLEKLEKLNPVNYKFIKQDKEIKLDLPETLQHGFIAQELEEVYPELVEEVTHGIYNENGEMTGSKTLKAVNYIGLISVLTESVIELNEEVESLKGQLANNTKTYVVTNNNTLSPEQVKDIAANGYYLGQNTPNPFSEVTTIEYSIPQNESDASVWIMNLNGQVIKEYKLNERKGSITVNAGALQKGVYLYSLIGSGQEIISKKMVVK